MTYSEVMRALEEMGTAQNRKVYARRGVGANMFGVSYANLRKLERMINTDHALARRLWASGNHDARVLATMVADPAATDARTLEAWAGTLDSYVLADAFTGLVARTPHADKKVERWTKSKQEFVGQVGWSLIAHRALSDMEVGDAYLEDHVDRIEAEIHRSQNRVRHAMNQALIAIGVRNARLERKALAAAKRIGKVDVDHGETGCRTPDASAYIAKTKDHRAKRKGKARA